MRLTLFLLFLLPLLISPAIADNHGAPRVPAQAGPASPVDPTAEIELGSESYRGVIATARLEPLAPAEAQPGAARAFLLSLSFVKKNAGPVLKGDVAVRISAPDGKVSAPLRLNPVDGLFQAEILLAPGGESLIRIGSKLPDEKKRIYRFFYTLL